MYIISLLFQNWFGITVFAPLRAMSLSDIVPVIATAMAAGRVALLPSLMGYLVHDAVSRRRHLIFTALTLYYITLSAKFKID